MVGIILLFHKGCCGVVLDQQGISNITGANSQATPRKRLNLMTGEMSRLDAVESVFGLLCLSFLTFCKIIITTIYC